jgi:hypothetical protein
MGKVVQHQAQPVNLSFNPPLNRKRELEEIGVEISRVNLKRLLSCRGSGLTGRRWLGGQGTGNDRFALRVHTVAKSVESEAVRTGGAGFHQTRCEVGYVVNPCGSTPVQDCRARLGSRFR